MRLAIFGDIHGNLEALHAVIRDAQAQQVTHYVCLGDVVGFGANPHECIREVQKLACPVVKGIYDEMAAQVDDLKRLDSWTKEAVIWTRNRTTYEDKQWLRTRRLVQQVSVQGADDFIIVHSTLDRPGNFTAVRNLLDASASFSFQHTQLCFYGHTHAPGAYVQDYAVRAEHFDNLRLQTGKKYFINAGSVGQSWDGDWRAAYCLYTPGLRSVQLRRLEYDVCLTREKQKRSGLPMGLQPTGIDPLAETKRALTWRRIGVGLGA